MSLDICEDAMFWFLCSICFLLRFFGFFLVSGVKSLSYVVDVLYAIFISFDWRVISVSPCCGANLYVI